MKHLCILGNWTKLWGGVLVKKQTISRFFLKASLNAKMIHRFPGMQIIFNIGFIWCLRLHTGTAHSSSLGLMSFFVVEIGMYKINCDKRV